MAGKNAGPDLGGYAGPNFSDRLVLAFGEGVTAYEGANNHLPPGAGLRSYSVLWDGNVSSGTVSDTGDSTTVQSAAVGRFGKRMAAQQASTGTGTGSSELTVDVTPITMPNPLWLSFWIDEAVLSTGTSGLAFRVADGAGFTGNTAAHTFSGANVAPGWNLIPLLTSAPDWSVAPPATLASFQYRIFSTSGVDRTHYADAVLLTAESLTQVCISIDDGDVDTITFASIANARGIKITAGINPDTLGTGDIMTAAQVRTLRDDGNEIALHDTNSPTWPDEGAEDAIVTRVVGQREQLEQIVGGRLKTAIYPGGDFGRNAELAATDITKTLNAMSRSGISICRATAAGGMLGSVPVGGGAMTIKSVELDNTTSLAAAQAAVDDAITQGSMVNFNGHLLGTPAALTWDQSDFTSLCDYIQTRLNNGTIDHAPTITQAMSNLSRLNPQAAAANAGYNSRGLTYEAR